MKTTIGGIVGVYEDPMHPKGYVVVVNDSGKEGRLVVCLVRTLGSGMC